MTASSPPPDAADDFDLDAFLPYQLNRAAEAASARFQAVYRAEFGMTRTQWRVVRVWGRSGPMPAAQICRLSHLDKTKVSRAVSALEGRGWLARNPADGDRRVEILSLTAEGRGVRAHLAQRAIALQAELAQTLGAARLATGATAARGCRDGHHRLRVAIRRRRAPRSS